MALRFPYEAAIAGISDDWRIESLENSAILYKTFDCIVEDTCSRFSQYSKVHLQLPGSIDSKQGYSHSAQIYFHNDQNLGEDFPPNLLASANASTNIGITEIVNPPTISLWIDGQADYIVASPHSDTRFSFDPTIEKNVKAIKWNLTSNDALFEANYQIPNSRSYYKAVEGILPIAGVILTAAPIFLWLIDYRGRKPESSANQVTTKSMAKSLDLRTIKSELEKYNNNIKQLIIDEIQGIDSPIHLTPPDLSTILSNIETERNWWIVGERGIGKSAILRQIYEALNDSNKVVILLRADEIISENEFLEVTKGIGIELDVLATQITENNDDFYILIDSVDTIARDKEIWNSFALGIVQLQQNTKVHTIFTIRKSDFDFDEIKFRREWGRVTRITGFSIDQVDEVLQELKVKGRIGKEVYSILQKPFYLNMLASIVRNGKISGISGITNQYQFFVEHYNQVVRNDDKDPSIASEKVNIVDAITRKMIEQKKLKVSNFAFPRTPALEKLLTDGVITDSSDEIQFFHDLYFDYMASRIITENNLISDYLENVGENLFLKSTISFTLTYLKSKNFDDYLRSIKAILQSTTISYYWKLVVIEHFSTITEITPEEDGLLTQILDQDQDLQGLFFGNLIEKKNPAWYFQWKDTQIIKWASDSSFVHRKAMVNYIAIAVKGGTSG